MRHLVLLAILMAATAGSLVRTVGAVQSTGPK
jgi:hypothetical protein